MVFYSISSNMEEALSINPSGDVFVCGDFIVHHKDCVTYSGGTDESGEVCYNFSISDDLRWLTFLLRSQTVVVSLLFWIYFFLFMLVFV